VTPPKDDLRLEGLLDKNGEIDGEQHVPIRHVDEGAWALEPVEEIDA
jgi:hypothetical protein